MPTTFGKAIRVLFVSLVYVSVYAAVQTAVEAVAGFMGMLRAMPYVSSGPVLWQVFNKTVVSNLFVCSLISIALTLAVYWALGVLRERRLGTELCLRPISATPILPAVVLALGCRLLVSAYAVVSSYVPFLRESAQSAPDLSPASASPFGLVLSLLSVTLAAPIFEEILFRGLVQRELLRGFPPVLAIAVSSLIFAAAHPLVFQSVFAFFVGLACGWCYYRTGSLLTGIVIHVVFNATALITESFAYLSPAMTAAGAAAGAALTVIGLLWIGSRSNVNKAA